MNVYCIFCYEPNLFATDSSLPATDTGIPNAKSGHCMKTMAIIKEVLRRVQKMPHVKWIFLADDDTILGYVTTLYALLSPFHKALTELILNSSVILL